MSDSIPSKPVETDSRVCTTCVLCVREDYGYSNWTVEGTSLACLVGLNPLLDGQDEPWREVTPELAKALDVAKACPKYRQGTPAAVDCDREGIPYKSVITPQLILKAGYTEDNEAASLLAERLQ